MKKIVLTFIIATILIFSIPQKVQALDTFTVGMECDYSPYNWTTTKAKASKDAVLIDGTNSYCEGYDVMVATNLAKQMNKQIVIKKITWDGLIPALQANTIDAIIAGMSPTEERKQTIDFSQAYYKDSPIINIVTKSDSSYKDAKSINEFSGAKIAAQLGTFHVSLIEQMQGVTKATDMENYAALIEATKAGVIDGFTADENVGKEIAASSDELKTITFAEGNGFVLDEASSTVAVGIKKGNQTLLASINKGLDNLDEAKRAVYMANAGELSNSDVISGNFFNRMLYVVKNYWPIILEGYKNTLIIAISGTSLGILLGIGLAFIRTLKTSFYDVKIIKILKLILRFLASTYVDIVRGTPMIVQAVIFYYGLAASGLILNPIIAGIIIVTFNTAAYIAEIMRSGIESIDTGQMEAARTLGLSHWQGMKKVVLPQAFKNTLPALGNELIVNVKDTSVLSVIAVTELYYMTKSATSESYLNVEGMVIAAIIYLITTMFLSKLMQYLFKMKKSANFMTSQTAPEVNE